jgi:hypothetical protein
MYLLMRRALFCRLNKHRPRLSTVEWHDIRYVGTCRDCQASIERLARHTWRQAG